MAGTTGHFATFPAYQVFSPGEHPPPPEDLNSVEIWKNCNRRFDARRRRSGVAARTGVHNTVGRGAAEPARRGIQGSRVVGWRRTRRLVFRSSTGPEISHILACLEHHGGRKIADFGHLAIDQFDIRLYPANAGNLNLAILRDPENGRNIGQDRKSTRLNSSH